MMFRNTVPCRIQSQYEAVLAGFANRFAENSARQVVCACLLDPENGSVLVVSRRDHSSQFTLPKGGVETGEDFAQAAAREVREEVGLECDYRQFSAISEPVYVWRKNREQLEQVRVAVAVVSGLSGKVPALVSPEGRNVEMWNLSKCVESGRFPDFLQPLMKMLEAAVTRIDLYSGTDRTED